MLRKSGFAHKPYWFGALLLWMRLEPNAGQINDAVDVFTNSAQGRRVLEIAVDNCRVGVSRQVEKEASFVREQAEIRST
jgi:hypothetical protein